jgi:hypothetical protein
MILYDEKFFRSMNSKTILAVSLAAVFAVSMIFASTSLPSYAAPPGVTPGAKLIGTVNVLIHPGEWVADDTTCPNNGNRIFFGDDGTGRIGTIKYWWDPSVNGLKVTDCDGTTDKIGEIKVPDRGKSAVYLKLLGPKSSELDVFCAEIVDINDDENLCLLNEVRLSRSGTFTKIAENALADGLEGVTFDLVKVDGKVFKHLQLRAYLEP